MKPHDHKVDMEAQFAAHAAKVAQQDIKEGRPGHHRDVSNSPAWRLGYDAGTQASQVERRVTISVDRRHTPA